MATIQGSVSYQNAASGVTTPGTAPTVTVTGSGHSILVIVNQNDSLTRTFTVSSSVDGSFGDPVAYYNPGAALGIWRLDNATAGAHTINVVASTTGVGFGSYAQVVEDLGTATPVTDTQFATTNGASHISGGTGVTTTTAAFVVCVNAVSGSLTTSTPGSGYTELGGPPAGSARLTQYQDFATPITLEQGAWTSTGTSRANRGLIVAFPEAGTPSTPTAAGGAFTAWFGR
jgi:hypothetical protein